MESSSIEIIPIESDPSLTHLLGQRVQLRQSHGSIRYVGQLVNNPKAGTDVWLGIEWDDEAVGKHQGTVDGVTYFTCQFHQNSPNYGMTHCGSFVRHGKIAIGGQTLREALIEKYRPDDMMTAEEKERLKKAESEELYVNTDKSGMKKI